MVQQLRTIPDLGGRAARMLLKEGPCDKNSGFVVRGDPYIDYGTHAVGPYPDKHVQPIHLL